MLVRSVVSAALAAALLVTASGEASAGFWHRKRVLWPHVYAPSITGNLFDGAESDNYDNGYNGSQDAYYADPNADSLDPVYEPQVKKQTVRKSAKKIAAKPPVATSKPAAKTAAKTTLAKKPATAPAITTASITSSTTTLKKPLPTTTSPAPVKPASTAKVASLQPSGGSGVACSKGAEIVSGYGFTSVKPRSCTGTTYTFDAARGANAYLIKLAAASGEITDVQKLK